MFGIPNPVGKLIDVATDKLGLPEPLGDAVKISIGVLFELGQSLIQVFKPPANILAQDSGAVVFTVPFSRILEVTIAAKLDKAGFEPVVIPRRHRFGPPDLFCEFPRRPSVGVQCVSGIAGGFEQLGETI